MFSLQTNIVCSDFKLSIIISFLFRNNINGSTVTKHSKEFSTTTIAFVHSKENRAVKVDFLTQILRKYTELVHHLWIL